MITVRLPVSHLHRACCPDHAQILVVISFICVVAITDAEQSSSSSSVILTYLPPVVILAINQLMKVAARKLAMWERHSTYGTRLRPRLRLPPRCHTSSGRPVPL